MQEKKKARKEWTGSQITGTASSYARKYALNGLFNIDDTKDADTDEFAIQTDEMANKKITKLQTDALYELIKNRAIENDEVIAILKEKGYSKLADIKNKDFGNIAKQFEMFRRD